MRVASEFYIVHSRKLFSKTTEFKLHDNLSFKQFYTTSNLTAALNTFIQVVINDGHEAKP